MTRVPWPPLTYIVWTRNHRHIPQTNYLSYAKEIIKNKFWTTWINGFGWTIPWTLDRNILSSCLMMLGCLPKLFYELSFLMHYVFLFLIQVFFWQAGAKLFGEVTWASCRTFSLLVKASLQLSNNNQFNYQSQSRSMIVHRCLSVLDLSCVYAVVLCSSFFLLQE